MADASPLSDGFVDAADAALLADGAMQQVTAGGHEILLARVDGTVYATTAFCTHYGAPLATGVLHAGTVVCPWHHACFRLDTGARTEPPALDSLRTFPVREADGRIFVRVPADADAHGADVDYRDSDGREPATPDAPAVAADARLFLILGAGAAAQAAAEELRACGFRGRLALATPETHAPYDRTTLSKAFLAGDADASALPLRDGAFDERHRLEVWTDREATALDPDARTVTFSTGDVVAYDAALVATGGTPRTLGVPGADLDGVVTLRSWSDAAKLVGQAEGATHAVVIGASFIGMEAASSLAKRGLSVTVVGRERVPFEAVLGAEMGRVFQRAAEEAGVTFRLGVDVLAVERDGEQARAVTLSDGSRAVGHLVLVGIGVTPATAWLAGQPFRRDDGGLTTDACLKLADGLYAAGDVAAVPDARTGQTVRIEHWRLAQQHGRTAARNLIADGDPTLTPEPFAGVPFFWTGQFGLSLRYVGHADGWEDTVVDGSLDARTFAVYYVHHGRVVAGAFAGRDRDAAAFHLLMAAGRTPTPDDLRAGLDLHARLRGEA